MVDLSNPALASAVAVVARRQWFVYSFDSPASFESFFIRVPRVFLPILALSYHGPDVVNFAFGL